MSHNPYKTRQGGATVTVFVPYDCKNHCPFCINKAEYADRTGFSLERIVDSIRRMDAITPFCDFVFTGGEPLADLGTLQTMLDAVPATHKVYINTTLPVSEHQSEDDLLSFLARNRDKITCLNISRHMQHYVEESNDDLLRRLPVRFRINCVLYLNYPADHLIPYLERFRAIPGATIQFRFDYTATTPENLYDREHDKILHDLRSIAPYTGLDGCRIRCGFHFDYKGMELTYHKTLPYSTIEETDPDTGITYDILYDILIKQTGAIHSDWTGVVMDVPAYEQVVFEPYDLRWLEGPFPVRRPQLLYQGHGSLRLTTSQGKVIYIDPFAGEGYDAPADLILVTHQHPDHNQVDLPVKKPDCIIWQNSNAHIGGDYYTLRLDFVTVEAVEAYNHHHKKEECVGYIVTVDGVSLYFAGDTGETDQMSSMASRHLDYAVLPMDPKYTMDAPETNRCAALIAAKHTIPIHMAAGRLFDPDRAKLLTVPGALIVPDSQTVTL